MLSSRTTRGLLLCLGVGLVVAGGSVAYLLLARPRQKAGEETKQAQLKMCPAVDEVHPDMNEDQPSPAPVLGPTAVPAERDKTTLPSTGQKAERGGRVSDADQGAAGIGSRPGVHHMPLKGNAEGGSLTFCILGRPKDAVRIETRAGMTANDALRALFAAGQRVWHHNMCPGPNGCDDEGLVMIGQPIWGYYFVSDDPGLRVPAPPVKPTVAFTQQTDSYHMKITWRAEEDPVFGIPVVDMVYANGADCLDQKVWGIGDQSVTLDVLSQMEGDMMQRYSIQVQHTYAEVREGIHRGAVMSPPSEAVVVENPLHTLRKAKRVQQRSVGARNGD